MQEFHFNNILLFIIARIFFASKKHTNQPFIYLLLKGLAKKKGKEKQKTFVQPSSMKD